LRPSGHSAARKHLRMKGEPGSPLKAPKEYISNTRAAYAGTGYGHVLAEPRTWGGDLHLACRCGVLGPAMA
jgi:hypothetical protein